MDVFLGIHDEYEVLYILETRGLIDGGAVRLQNRIKAENAERILRPIVQKAFARYFNPSGWRH
jgi:hypothetical protein